MCSMNLDNKKNLLIEIEKEINEMNVAQHLLDNVQSFFENHKYSNVGSNIIFKAEPQINNLDVDLSFMKNNAENRAFRQICSNRFIVGKMIIFLKKMMRKLLKWYIEPVCDQQTVFNRSTISALETLRFELGGVREDNLQSIDNCLLHISEIKKVLETNNNSLNSKIQEIKKVLETNNNSLNSKVQEIKKQQEELAPKYTFGNVISSSQSGEDTIVAYILDALRISFNECTYLDLGANHARAMSNSYMLYRFGARGVLVEANPKLIPELQKERKGDLILNRCIAVNKSKSLAFYIMSGDGLSTTDYNRVQEVMRINPGICIEEKVDVEAITIDEILNNYFLEVPMLVNIDIEGVELDVLNQFDLKHRRPLIIIVETVPYFCDFKVLKRNTSIINFMKTMDYEEYAFTGINSIFVDTKRLRSYTIDRGKM